MCERDRDDMFVCVVVCKWEREKDKVIRMRLPYVPFSAILAFVIVKDGVTDEEGSIFDGLKAMVKQGIGSFATPHQFLVSWLIEKYV